MADFQLVATQDFTYIDDSGRLVEGYRVTFNMPAFGETHTVKVPNLDPNTVKTAIDAVVKQRIALSKLV